jgi:alkylated DNA repair dioxygenase AlkB
MSKIIYPPHQNFQYADDAGTIRACYFSKIPFFETHPNFLSELEKLPFTRVEYISQYGKRNRTPRKTWAFGQVQSEVVSFSKRGYTLNFRSEPMPSFLKELAQYCCEIAKFNWNFDPGYNSCIIGRYDNRDDSIGFHEDTEPFLAHHFCANVTLGIARDFQFKDQNKRVHEVALQNESVFFFNAVEHSLPKRASVQPGQVRYSISFRNMKADLGIANTFYYCRGLAGAIDDNDKQIYQQKLASL